MMLRLESLLRKGPGHALALARWYSLRFVRGIASHRIPSIREPAGLFSRLNLTNPNLELVREAVTNGNTAAATRQLATYFRVRPYPAFFFNGDTKPDIVSLVDRREREATVAKADDICRLKFQFRGEPPVVFEGAVNWEHQLRHNKDWTWDLNRHAYFLTLGRAYAYTGDSRYAAQYKAFLTDWLAKNPPERDHPNWRSPLEAAIRISTWIWGLHYFLDAPELDDETLLACLNGIEVHGRFLAANLEYHVASNHLLLEAKALALCGLLFPEFTAAGPWREIGLERVWAETLKQVYEDGVHGELATYYHRLIAGDLLELLVLLENNDQAIPPAIVDRFSRMLDFEASLTRSDGSTPLLGDSALDDVLIRWSPLSGGRAFLGRYDLAASPVDEPTLWLIGPERATRFNNQAMNGRQPESRLFPQGGYAIMRSTLGNETRHLVFDCGPYGYPLAPAHGHADALSIDLYANGSSLLLDPGVYGYFLGADWRNFFRGTRAHNTVVVDNQDQSHLLDTMRVHRPAHTSLHRWISHEAFDFVDASHDGYTRLKCPITHRRQLFFVKGDYCVVVDRLEGSGEHQFDLLFHFPAGAHIKEDPNGTVLEAVVSDAMGLMIIPATLQGTTVAVKCGETEPIQGWVSLFSGRKEAAPVACLTKKAEAPVIFCTVLYPYRRDLAPSVSVSPLALDESDAAGCCIAVDEYEDLMVIRTGAEGTVLTFDRYKTDSRITFIRRQPKKDPILSRAILCDGRRLSQGDTVVINEPQISEVTTWNRVPAEVD